jgi:hypothetical protein
MEISKEKFIGIYPAGGLLVNGGFLFFDLGAVFEVVEPTGIKQIRFHSEGFGDDFDFSASELEGFFSKTVDKLIGKCTFNLEVVDVEEGELVLQIFQDDIQVGEFYGVSEGLGEAAFYHHKGKLTTPNTKTHNNKFIFECDKSIESMSFVFGNQYAITDGQPWGEVESSFYYDKKNKRNELKIDVGAGRKASKKPAQFYNSIVNSNTNKMIHTRGGDNVPKELNFAFNGILKINNDSFNVCIGQGHHGSYNNWHIASDNMNSISPFQQGDLGNYHLTNDGSYGYKVSKKK